MPRQRAVNGSSGTRALIKYSLWLIAAQQAAAADAGGGADRTTGCRRKRPARLSAGVRRPRRLAALAPTVTELLPKDTQPPTETDHHVLPSLSDPNNSRRTMNEALNKYLSVSGTRSSLLRRPLLSLVDYDAVGESRQFILFPSGGL